MTTITDVKNHPEFADRLVEHTYAGKNYTDFWVFDFTLEELKTLRLV